MGDEEECDDDGVKEKAKEDREDEIRNEDEDA